MCTIKDWRKFIPSAPKSVSLSGPSEKEFAIESEEVELAERVNIEIKKSKGLSRANTWFYPYQKSFELVLGWNHGVVLRLGKSGWELEWIFLAVKDEYHKAFVAHKYKAIVMDSTKATADWKVFKVDKTLPVCRVTTYRATTCSVTVAFSKGKNKTPRLMMCHMDASYPIPIPVMIAWCQEKDGVVEKSCLSDDSLDEYCVISSICPGDEEKAKFSKKVWIGEVKPAFDYRALLLVRAAVNQETFGMLESHTQFGLLLSGNLPAFGGFIGWPGTAQIRSLYSMDLMDVVAELAKKLKSWDETAETKASEELLKPLLKNDYGHWLFHKLCVDTLYDFRDEYGSKDWSRAQLYVAGMASIFEDPNGKYKNLMSAILATYQKKIWMPLSADHFETYCG